MKVRLKNIIFLLNGIMNKTFNMATSSNKTNGHKCTYCDAIYNKKDLDVCPHCGGDGGGRTAKVWRPTKRQKKEFAKKNKYKLN